MAFALSKAVPGLPGGVGNSYILIANRVKWPAASTFPSPDIKIVLALNLGFK